MRFYLVLLLNDFQIYLYVFLDYACESGRRLWMSKVEVIGR